MRLIDADEAIKELRYDLKNDPSMYCSSTDKIIRDEKIIYAIDVINEQPTVLDINVEK